jgi:hypothetical protein
VLEGADVLPDVARIELRVEKLSPPAATGTKIIAITGDQGTTR